METTINTDQINQGLDNIEGIFGSVDGILYSIFGIGSLAFTGISAVVTLIISIAGILWVVANYLLEAIPLFIMARKTGYKHAWMAFFPYTNTFLTFMLPIREFNLFNLIKSNRRDIMALIYLGMNIIGRTVVSVLAILTSGVVVIGPLISTFGGTILMAFIYAFKWRMYYDILMTFGQKSNAIWVASVSLFVPWLFLIFTIFSCKNPPEYGVGNYYKYHSMD